MRLGLDWRSTVVAGIVRDVSGKGMIARMSAGARRDRNGNRVFLT